MCVFFSVDESVAVSSISDRIKLDKPVSKGTKLGSKLHVVNATNEQGTSSNTDSQVKDNIETKKNTECKCFYTNARSIVNKLDEYELYIDEEKPDIIGITETWLTSGIENR